MKIEKVILSLIKIYQTAISPLMGRKCRFLPTCSDYCFLAIKKHGLAKGFLLFGKRISHCHIFSQPKVDLP